MPSLSTLVSSSIVLALAYLAAIGCAAVVFALRLGGRREDPPDSRDAQSSSRFTIPVSVIVPLTSGVTGFDGSLDAKAISRTIASVIDQDYPELELIVAAEGLSEEIWSALKFEWQLEPREYFYRQTLPTEAVRKVYRSPREPRLLVVDKGPSTNGADAVNCGVNLAHFRYVTTIRPGITFERDALLRAMSAPLRDAAGVAGATSHVEGEGWQRLSSVRSMLRTRIAQTTSQEISVVHDTVAVWRRDAIVELGGFSTTAADPDVDMAIRMPLSSNVSGRVVRSPEIFGRANAVAAGVQLRNTRRSQLAALQGITTLSRSRHASPGSLVLAVMSDVLTPLAQAWVAAATLLSAALGWVPWRDAMAAVVLLSFGRAAVSTAALLVRGSAPGAPDAPALARLLLAAPFEFVATGPAVLAGRITAAWSFAKRS
jgi:cellulose synthase/poly-beta-1,6-N-acetylglucosamine synthase-like glycosyltransferase